MADLPAAPAPATRGVMICASSALVNGGAGVRFPVVSRYGKAHHRLTGFAIRFQEVAYAYLNQCAHVPSEMDWQQGQFFDHSGLYLMCATHGAVYEPESGRCAGGPCRGGRLRPLSVLEHSGVVYWRPDDLYFPPETDPVVT